MLFLSPQAHRAVHRESHCFPIRLLEKQLQTYAERQDRKRGDGRSGGFIWSHPEYHSWAEAMRMHFSGCCERQPGILNEMVTFTERQIHGSRQCWGKTRDQLPHTVFHDRSSPQLTPSLGPQFGVSCGINAYKHYKSCAQRWLACLIAWGWARCFHHTLSWQSLSSRSWPQHWAWRHSWRSCRETALSVRSLASQTHMGSHLHVLSLPTAVPNKQQTNGVALKWISTYHGTDAEHNMNTFL